MDYDKPKILYKINSINHDTIFTSLHDLKKYIQQNCEYDNEHYTFTTFNEYTTITIKMRSLNNVMLWLINNNVLMELNE